MRNFFHGLVLLIWLSTNLMSQEVVVRDAATVTDTTVDIVYLMDGSKVTGKIKDIDAQKIVVDVQGASVPIDARKVERIERNVDLDPESKKPRYAEITLKDKTTVIGQITRSEADTTFVQAGGSELRIKSENIVGLRYVDAEQARLKEIEKSRKAGFELTLKGGSPFYQHGTFRNTLRPGVLALLEFAFPHWFIAAARIHLQLGLQTGVFTNPGKISGTRFDLLPANMLLLVAYPFPRSRFDAFLGISAGGNFTRFVGAGQEKISLDISGGGELGFRFYATSRIHVRLASLWYTVYQRADGSLNHLGSYLGVGYRF
ncbi:MAG: hypothetical protein NZM25_09085 [Leptospiraceae bacterium]|nr:hypothetical protein [Leptospiraceae bacterium]MDW8307293.1 hypothetical protein [Leptospiraceae bacterium]